ncbi:hypothetical protein ANN_06633 [Periplaneta americana]|uniref:Uncharacterized protein n=1 Tax=Periplaneta americana TaxID=6978 RepID=A0ABQ8TE32_PERAM|nr:hypothetical protein ANN_06633 [Periplaneta americana]
MESGERAPRKTFRDLGFVHNKYDCAINVRYAFSRLTDNDIFDLVRNYLPIFFISKFNSFEGMSKEYYEIKLRDEGLPTRDSLYELFIINIIGLRYVSVERCVAATCSRVVDVDGCGPIPRTCASIMWQGNSPTPVIITVSGHNRKRRVKIRQMNPVRLLSLPSFAPTDSVQTGRQLQQIEKSGGGELGSPWPENWPKRHRQRTTNVTDRAYGGPPKLLTLSAGLHGYVKAW